MPDARSADDLTALLDRARQERFRLLDLLKQSRAAVAETAAHMPSTNPYVAPTPQSHPTTYSAETAERSLTGLPGGDVQKLIEKVGRLNDAVNARMEKLAAAETRVNGRIDTLERLELKLTNVAERFESLVNDAKESRRVLEPALDEAEARGAELRAITEGLQAHAHELAKNVDQRLAEQTADFERKLDAHHERLTQEQIAEHQSFADAVSRQKQNHLDQLARELSEKRAELIEQYAQVRDELAQRFKQEQQDALIDAEQAGIVEVGNLREKLSGMLRETVGEAESHGHSALATVREQVVQAMGRADDVHRSLKQRLDKTLAGYDTNVADKLAATDDDLLIRGQKLDERLAGLADLFDHQADQILDDLKGRANTMLDQMAASLDVPAKAGRDAASGATPGGVEENPQLRVA
ncbi:MAG: hypothetical protein AAGE65_02160 [Planctomycetota bacterium]